MQKFYAVAISVLLFACSSNDPEPLGKYEQGVLVINEGNFSDADGSLGFYDPISENTMSQAFQVENDRPFGGIMQSATIVGSDLYMIDNLGSKIEIAEANTLKSNAVISEGLNLPRYMASNEDHAFVSNWGPYAADFSSPESFIAVIDLTTNEVIDQISVSSRPEALLILNGQLIVTSLASETMSSINIASFELEEIPAPFGTSQIFTTNGKVWMSASNGIYEFDDASNTFEQLVTIDDFSGKFTGSGDGSELFALSSQYAPDFSYTENAILKIDIPGGSMTEIFAERNLYGLGFAETTQEIYVANAQAFQSNGTIIRIRTNGEETGSFPTGRGPAGFVFRNY